MPSDLAGLGHAGECIPSPDGILGGSREGWGKGKSWCYTMLRTYKDLPGNELDVTVNRLSCAHLGLLTGQKQPAAGRRLLITRHPAVGTPGFLE